MDEKKPLIQHDGQSGASVVVTGGVTTDRPQTVEVERSSGQAGEKGGASDEG